MSSSVNNITPQASQTTPKDSSTEVNGYYALLIALEGTTRALQGTAVVQTITTQALIQDENSINVQQTKDTFEQITWDMTHGKMSDTDFGKIFKDFKQQPDGTWVYTSKDGKTTITMTNQEFIQAEAKWAQDGTEADKEAKAAAQKKYPKWYQKKKREKYEKQLEEQYLNSHYVDVPKTPTSAQLGAISDYNLRVQASRDYLTGLVKIDTNLGQVLSANASSTASAITQALDNFSSDLSTMTQIVQSIFKT